MILRFLPNDLEANQWLKKISSINTNNKKEVVKKYTAKKIIKSSSISKKYEISNTMATFTMLEVLKKQKSYQQALLVLNFLEQKKIDLPRIKKERELINQLFVLLTSSDPSVDSASALF